MSNLTSDTKEKGLETLIVESLKNDSLYEQGSNDDYNKLYAVDEWQLRPWIASSI